jgi:hypothetical protein
MRWVEAGSVTDLFVSRSAGPAGAPALNLMLGPDESGGISCVAPLSVAWQRMVQILFRPFDLAKWFALGFTAWLATLGEEGGGGNISSAWERRKKAGQVDVNAVIQQVQDFFRAHLGVILVVGSILLLIGIAAGIALAWVRCRGKFMFLSNVDKNAADIARPWEEHRRRANSLFVWMLVYGFVVTVIVLALLAATIVLLALPLIRHERSLTAPAIIVAVLAWCFVMTPIMYWFDLSVLDAWRKFLSLLRRHFWSFVGYSFFYLLLWLGVLAALAALTIVTCCIAGCLLGLPYLGTVFLLPLFVFFRLYSLEYLGQFADLQQADPATGGPAGRWGSRART